MLEIKTKMMRRRKMLILMLMLLLSASSVTAQDVYRLCSVDGKEVSEVFVPDVEESRPVGSVVKSFNFNGSSDQISVEAVSSSNFFSFNETSRNLILKSALDADTGTTQQAFILSCHLASSNIPTRVSITVQILIKDVNDNPPVFDKEEYHIDINETALNGSIIVTPIRAIDKDKETSSNGLVYYSILPDTYSSYFDIKDPVKPDLTLMKLLDYETLPAMYIKIVATDQPSSKEDQMNATTTLYINVIDDDDLPPVFGEPSYQGTVQEFSPKGTPVNLSTPISARDQDTTINASIRYSIKKATNDYFSIDKDTAEVSVNMSPPAGEISLMIEATQVDNKFRTDTTFLKIIVSANNSNPPRFHQDSYEASVPESLPLGSTILTVSASDDDFGSKLEYFFAAEEEMFALKGGALILRMGLDYETLRVYVFQIVAGDGQFNATTTVTVRVADVNDNNPVISPSSYTVDASRDQGAFIIMLQAVDYDDNTVLTYGLASHEDLFQVSNDGKLTISGDADSLTESEYVVVVTVTDNGRPPRQSSASITVKFPPLASRIIAPERSSDVVSICLGVVAATLLIIVIILTVYIIRRRLQSSEQLDKAKNRNTMDPRGILFKKHPGSRAPSRTALNFHDPEDAMDGGTTVAENPFTLDGNRNYGYVNSDESENDRDMDEIHIETAVIPYRNGHKFPSNGDIFQHMEDEDGLPVTKLDHSYQNGSLSTFKDSNSNESLHSDSTSSKRGLMKSMNGIATKSLPMKKLSWAGSNGETPSNKSLSSIDQDPSISPIDEKPEITVYF